MGNFIDHTGLFNMAYNFLNNQIFSVLLFSFVITPTEFDVIAQYPANHLLQNLFFLILHSLVNNCLLNKFHKTRLTKTSKVKQDRKGGDKEARLNVTLLHPCVSLVLLCKFIANVNYVTLKRWSLQKRNITLVEVTYLLLFINLSFIKTVS